MNLISLSQLLRYLSVFVTVVFSEKKFALIIHENFRIILCWKNIKIIGYFLLSDRREFEAIFYRLYMYVDLITYIYKHYMQIYIIYVAFRIKSLSKNSVCNPPSQISTKLCVFSSYYEDIITFVCLCVCVHDPGWSSLWGKKLKASENCHELALITVWFSWFSLIQYVIHSHFSISNEHQFEIIYA